MERHECDLLVAGSGAGGFGAAVTAAHAGLDVLIVEKEPLFGGTTAYSAGVVWIPMNAACVAAGLKDSPAKALRYLESEVGAMLDRARARAYIENATAMLAFFERETHVKYLLMPAWSDYHPELPGASQGGRSLLPEPFDGRELGEWFVKLRPPIRTMMLFGGMSVSRDDLPHPLNFTRSAASAWHVAGLLARYARDRFSYPRGTRIANGNALIARLAKSAFEKKVGLWLEAPLARLVRSGERVTGAVVRRNGREVEVAARRGVVLACGGFPASAELRARHYRHVAAGKNHVPLAPPGNTGDGVRAAEEAGAMFQAELDQPAAWTPVSLVPQADGSVTPFPHSIDRCKPGYIAVDRRGRRFGNEADSYHDFVSRLFEACKMDSKIEAFLVCDHRALRLYAVGNDQASVMGGKYPGAGITIGPALTFGWLAGRHATAGAP